MYHLSDSSSALPNYFVFLAVILGGDDGGKGLGRRTRHKKMAVFQSHDFQTLCVEDEIEAFLRAPRVCQCVYSANFSTDE